MGGGHSHVLVANDLEYVYIYCTYVDHVLLKVHTGVRLCRCGGTHLHVVCTSDHYICTVYTYICTRCSHMVLWYILFRCLFVFAEHLIGQNRPCAHVTPASYRVAAAVCCGNMMLACTHVWIANYIHIPLHTSHHCIHTASYI